MISHTLKLMEVIESAVGPKARCRGAHGMAPRSTWLRVMQTLPPSFLKRSYSPTQTPLNSQGMLSRNLSEFRPRLKMMKSLLIQSISNHFIPAEKSTEASWCPKWTNLQYKSQTQWSHLGSWIMHLNKQHNQRFHGFHLPSLRKLWHPLSSNHHLKK